MGDISGKTRIGRCSLLRQTMVAVASKTSCIAWHNVHEIRSSLFEDIDPLVYHLCIHLYASTPAYLAVRQSLDEVLGEYPHTLDLHEPHLDDELVAALKLKRI